MQIHEPPLASDALPRPRMQRPTHRRLRDMPAVQLDEPGGTPVTAAESFISRRDAKRKLRKRSRERRRQRQRYADGLCEKCPRQTRPGRTRCGTCAFKKKLQEAGVAAHERPDRPGIFA